MTIFRYCVFVLTSAITCSCPAGIVLFTDPLFRIDGVNYGQPNDPPIPSNVDLSQFDDFSQSLAPTGLGTITVDLTNAGSYSILAFFDHEIGTDVSLDPFEFADEFGAAFGTVPNGLTWRVGDLVFNSLGDVVNSFAANQLDNTVEVNSVFAGDVYLAMGWNFSLSPGETAKVVFELEDTEPTSGFYLQQFDDGEPESIYLSSTLTITGAPTNVIPEPASLLVWAPCLGLVAVRRRRGNRRR